MLIFIAFLAAVSACFAAYFLRQFITRELEAEAEPAPRPALPQPRTRPLGDHRLDCADILRAIGAGR